MDKLMLSIVITLLCITSCSSPKSKEIQIEQENFSIDIKLATSCDEGTHGSSDEMYIRCENLYFFLTFLLNEQYNINHLKATGIQSGGGFEGIQFTESGMRPPFMYHVDLIFKDDFSHRIHSIPEVIQLIEQEYQLKVSYAEKTISIYELQIVNEEAYQSAVKNARALKKEKPTINLTNLDRLKSQIQFHYKLHVKNNLLPRDDRTLALHFSDELKDFKKQLENVGLALVSKEFKIPYPSIRYL